MFHLIGIGGIGMSALAHVLLDKGEQVSGSDLKESKVLDALREKGAVIHSFHAASHLFPEMKIVYSTDIKAGNSEMEQGKRLNLPFYHRSELLAELMNDRKPLLIGGTHGKTTTTSLLVWVLKQAGLDPSFAIGGIHCNLGVNGRAGQGDFFVAEADESDGSFLAYPSYGGILTNLEEEHMDFWKSSENLCRGFKCFAEKIASADHFFWCADDPLLSSLDLRGVGYGFGKAFLKIERAKEEKGRQVFDICFEGSMFKEIELPLMGTHNVLNASAVFGLCLRLGLKEDKIREGFNTFLGVKRRLEFKGMWKKVQIFDDYGHHPTEIKSTLQALRARSGNKKIGVVFQPHRFTRTQALFSSFALSFDEADLLILTDIYAASEAPIEGISGKHLAELIQTKKNSTFFYPRNELFEKSLIHLEGLDILLILGAGDITALGDLLT